MNTLQLQEILNNVQILDRRFELATTTDPIGWLVRVVYDEADVNTSVIQVQRSRPWFIEPTVTESEVVETVYAATMRSYDHVVREHFLYRGARVYSPHFNVWDRVRAARALETEYTKR